MKWLLLFAAITSDAVAAFFILCAYATMRWPPPQSIVPDWSITFLPSLLAVVATVAYLYHHTRSSHSLWGHILPATTLCFLLSCLALVFYFPLAYAHSNHESAARIRADLDRDIQQHQNP